MKQYVIYRNNIGVLYINVNGTPVLRGMNLKHAHDLSSTNKVWRNCSTMMLGSLRFSSPPPYCPSSALLAYESYRRSSCASQRIMQIYHVLDLHISHWYKAIFGDAGQLSMTHLLVVACQCQLCNKKKNTIKTWTFFFILFYFWWVRMTSFVGLVWW